ncbi:hypothetical protein ACMFMG_002338 [Clarireedia jacksonii]
MYWQLDEEVVLFAWLDFCIQSGVSYEDTIEDKVAEVGAKRSWVAIKSRLQILVSSFRARDENGRPLKAKGHENDEKVSVILERGTKCLQNPSADFRKKLKPVLQKYEKEHRENSEKLGSNEQSNLQAPSKQKAVSNLSVFSPAIQVRPEASDDVDKSSSEEESSLEEESSSEKETNQRKRPRLNQWALTDAGKKAQHGSTIDQINPTQNSIKDKQPRQDRTNSRSETIANLRENSFSGQNLPTAAVERMDNRTVSEPHHHQKGSGNLSSQHTMQLRHTLDVMQQQHYADMRDLYRKINQLEQENKDLKANNSIRQATSDEFQNAGRGPLEQKLREKNQEIYALTEKLHEKTNVALSIDMPPKPLQIMRVERFMNEIQFELKAMVQTSDSYKTLRLPKDLMGDLEQLVTAAFESPNQESDARTCLIDFVRRYGVSAVIMLLAVTALKKWIFLSGYPIFESKGSEKQELYEDIVLKSGGWDQLRWLDLAVYKARMETALFKNEHIRGKAVKLASRLSHALSIMFSEMANKNGFQFHTWGEDEETWQDRQYHYQKLFEHALQLKCDSILTDETYRFSFAVVPGREISDVVPPPNSWLRISIQIYKAMPSEGGKKHALVQTRNFLDSDPQNQLRLYQKDVYLTRYGSHLNSQKAREHSEHQVSNLDEMANVHNPGGPMDKHNYQDGITSNLITTQELSGTSVLRKSNSMSRNPPQQPADERHRSDVRKKAQQLAIADSSQAHGDQSPETLTQKGQVARPPKRVAEGRSKHFPIEKVVTGQNPSPMPDTNHRDPQGLMHHEAMSGLQQSLSRGGSGPDKMQQDGEVGWITVSDEASPSVSE